MDAVCRSDPSSRARIRRHPGHRLERHLSSSHLLGRTSRAFPADFARHRALSKVLQPVQIPHARRGGSKRRLADRIGHPVGDGPLRAHLRLFLVLESLRVVRKFALKGRGFSRAVDITKQMAVLAAEVTSEKKS